MVVRVRAPFSIEPEALVRGLNSNLSGDVRVLGAEFCGESFRPTNDATKKEYKYLFTNNIAESPFQRDMIANCPYELNFEKMKQACAVFVGEWDFKAFSCAGSNPASTIRKIYDCELVTDINPNFQEILPVYHCVRIAGNGFLKQMVRLIVGCLWHVGRGKLEVEKIQAALKGDVKERLGEVAPPQGLFKVKTWYGP